MPRAPGEDDYRKAYTVYNRSSELSAGLLEEPINASAEEKPEDGSLPPLSRDQKIKWFLLVLLQLLGTLAGTIPGPLMIYLQSQYFNDGHPCITRAETDTEGCKQALSTISFVSGWFQAGSGLLAFFLSPAIGKLSDSFGRRKILLVCFSYNLLGNGVLFFGQTPLMDHTPWLWIYFSLNVVNLWGGVSSAYLADIMPPEWRSIAFGINASIFGIGNTVGPLIDLIPFKGSSASSINYVTPFGITFGLNVAMFFIALFFLTETLPTHLRVPFTFGSMNSFKQLGILWTGPKGISNRFMFRRLAITVFVQIIGMDGCFLVTGFYVKQQFAISKNMNTLMNEARGISAIVIMWILYKPLLRCLGERGCIIMGLVVNFAYFLGYLLVVSNLTWVFFFTVFGMLGIVNYPSISSVKSQKCSPDEQGQVLGSLSAIQSLSICIGPLIFNNSYSLTTSPGGKAWMKHALGFIIPEKAIWYLGLIITFWSVCVSFTIPNPADIYVPGADENLSITNSEIARRIRLSPHLKGKSEQEIADAVQEALEEQAKLRQTTINAAAKMADYRKNAPASETVTSPLDRAPPVARAAASHPFTLYPGQAGTAAGDYRRYAGDYRK